jgi:tRNA pseudouridine synthase 9
MNWLQYDYSSYQQQRQQHPIALLAPSSKVLEYLLARGRIPGAQLALTVVDHKMPGPQPGPPDDLPPPPPVVVTPCDPWPRPYFYKDGLRRVTPYHYTYNTFCKERWRNREILEIFKDEFRDRPVEYYVRAKRRFVCRA